MLQIHSYIVTNAQGTEPIVRLNKSRCDKSVKSVAHMHPAPN